MMVAMEKRTEEVLRCTSGGYFGKKNPQFAPGIDDLENLTAVFIQRMHSSPDRSAKISFGDGFSVGGLPAYQVDSRTRMRPSSKWISGAFHVRPSSRFAHVCRIQTDRPSLTGGIDLSKEFAEAEKLAMIMWH